MKLYFQLIWTQQNENIFQLISPQTGQMAILIHASLANPGQVQPTDPPEPNDLDCLQLIQIYRKGSNQFSRVLFDQQIIFLPPLTTLPLFLQTETLDLLR